VGYRFGLLTCERTVVHGAMLYGSRSFVRRGGQELSQFSF
jgi:hypothetical protein